MERTYINEAQKAIGGTVKVQGFIENLRNSKYMAFIVLKDITGKLQITVEKEDHPDLVDTIDQLTPDSVITVTGKVVENDYVKMLATVIAVIIGLLLACFVKALLQMIIAYRVNHHKEPKMETDRKSTRLNSSHPHSSRMPSSA